MHVRERPSFQVAVLLAFQILVSWPVMSVGLGSPGEAPARVRSLIDAGRYEEAQAAAERLVSDANAKTGLEPVDASGLTDLLVEALLWNGRGAEAATLALAKQAVRVKESRLGSHDPRLPTSVRHLADTLFQAGDVSAAIAVYDRALELREGDSEADGADLGEDLDHFARALTRATRYDEAGRLLDRSLQVKERTLQPSDVRIARTLEGLGWLQQRRGDYGQARPLLERALAIREAASPTHPEIVGTFNLLGDQYWFEGDLPQARSLYVRAIDVAQKSLRGDHPDVALSLRNLATAVDGLGSVAEAKSLRERALAIADRSFGPSHPQLAGYLNDLANSDWHQGDYAAARSLYERALRIKEDRLGPEHLEVATTLYNLAEVHARLGDFAESRRLRDRAVTIWRRKLGPQHPYIALAFSALGEVLLEQGMVGQAQSLFEQAVAIRERTLGPDHPEVAVTLANLAQALARLGQPERAERLSARAVAILERASAQEFPVFATVLISHADLAADQGHFGLARDGYDRALTIGNRIFGTSHPDYARTQAGLAVAFAGLGESVQAMEAALQAEETGRQHLRVTLRSLPERQSLSYAATRPKGLDLALSLSTGVAQPDRRIVDALIKRRALVLDEMAARSRVSADASRPDAAPLFAALTIARERLANLVVRGPGAQRPQQYAALVNDARREKELAERALADKSVAFRDELARGEIGLDDVRKALPPHSALVAFTLYDRSIFAEPSAAAPSRASGGRSRARRIVPSYAAFVINASQSDVSMVPVGSASRVDALVGRWREEATGVLRVASAGEAERVYRDAGAALRHQIWDPIATHLADAETVFVVPDGTLNLVTLAALPVGRTRYLAEQSPVIHYLTAERDLVVDVAKPTANHGLLAIGSPAFEDPTLFTATALGRRARSAGSVNVAAHVANLRSSCGDLPSLRFEPLDGTTEEVHDVARLWTEPPTHVLEGREANERAFKTAAPGHRVIHLATHGFFLGSTCAFVGGGTRSVGGLSTPGMSQSNVELSENPLLLSGLALSGANRRAAAGPNDQDGILTAEEVAGLNLDGVEWAVLSACDTGLGAVKTGEGVFGLRRAFQIAGVHTVIMSLWPVEDQSALEWMSALYRGRVQKHLSTANAMREASLSVLRARRARGLSTHPFYWGSFVAAGDWR